MSKTAYFPVVVFRCKDCWAQHAPFTLTALAQALKDKGWMVPVYRLPAHAAQIEVIRIVVRTPVDRPLATALLAALEAVVPQLVAQADEGLRGDVGAWPARPVASDRVSSGLAPTCPIAARCWAG